MRPFNRNHSGESRSWARRLLIGFNILLALALLAGVLGLGYAKWRFGQVTKLDLGGILSGEGGSKDPMNVLLVGSDSRSDLAPGQSKQFGSAAEVAGQRSDTIMILHIDPRTQRAAILSIPRDLYIKIAGTGGQARINTSFENGPDRLIQTIQDELHIPIDHYAQVNFDGFKGIVNAIDGVTIRFDAPARDSLSGLNVAKAGCVKLTGDQALAYVRSRHYEAYERGRWQDDPRSDFSRIDRQQDFIRRVMRKAVDKASGNPLTLNSLISSGVKNLTVDNRFSLTDMTRLARKFQSLDPNRVQMMTLPTTSKTLSDGAQVLMPKSGEDKQTIDLFLNGPKATAAGQVPDAIPAGSMSVRVLNGSGRAGQASDAAGSLRDAGFVVSGVGDGKTATDTTIRYTSGGKAKADTIAKFIKGPTQLIEDKTLRGVDAIITTGSSFEGVNVPAGDAPAPTTTTAAPTATTAKPSPFLPSDAAC